MHGLDNIAFSFTQSKENSHSMKGSIYWKGDKVYGFNPLPANVENMVGSK